MADSHYTILNLSRTASESDIKKQFRKLAVQYHPDKNPGNAAAEAMMKKINAAYSILGDSVARKKYDQELDYASRPAQSHQNSSGSGRQSGQNYYDTYHFESWGEFINRVNTFFHDYVSPFNSTFNVNQQNYTLVINLTPEEARTGCVKPLDFVKTERCSACQGRVFSSGTCTKCINGGITLRSKNKTVLLPANAAHNSIWKSENELVATPGGKQIDLYIRVQIVDPTAKSELDREMVVDISLELAFKGGDLKIDTVRGKIKIKVPELSFTGKEVRAPNRGSRDSYTGAVGDLYITFVVKIPDNPTQIQEIWIEKIIEKQKAYEKHNN